MFFKIFQHLLPKARAWSTTANKQLRQFIDGLSAGIGDDSKEYFDDLNDDLRPQTTRQLSEWEDQFGLLDTDLTEQERRDRLDAAWKALGGQDPRYIEDTLRNAGFDVYVHEWWVPGSEPPVGTPGAAVPRNPNHYLRSQTVSPESAVDCGELLAECGESFAECGNTNNQFGYPLVNKILVTGKKWLVDCGDPDVECGEPIIECGNFDGFVDRQLNYVVPNDPAAWPYFLYIGGEIFPAISSISAQRRSEFEKLCLQICPAQQWLGMLITYVN